MRKGVGLYEERLRQCRRCGKLYKTNFKRSKFCPDCWKPNQKHQWAWDRHKQIRSMERFQGKEKRRR